MLAEPAERLKPIAIFAFNCTNNEICLRMYSLDTAHFYTVQKSLATIWFVVLASL